MPERKVATPSTSTQKTVKTAFRKAKPNLSLKVFVRTTTDPELLAAGKTWLKNKKANFAKPPLGLGATRKKKGTQGKK